MKYMVVLVCGLLSFFSPIRASAGIDMRSVSPPDPYARAIEFGYSETETRAMLSGERNDLWALVPKKTWTTQTHQLRDRMKSALETTGMDEALANVVINVCKVYARDPHHCVVFASAVACAESSCGQKFDPKNNSIFGVRAGLKSVYATRTLAVRDWVLRYNGTTSTNGWYVANEGKLYGNCKYPVVGNADRPGQKYVSYCDAVGTDFFTSFFYSNVSGSFPASEYCLSEVSSNSSDYCPNGYNNSKSAYLKVHLSQ